MKRIITVIFLFTYLISFGQKEIASIKMSTLPQSGCIKVWELVPMDSSHVYFISPDLWNKAKSGAEKKMFSRMIRAAKCHRPQGLYLVFLKEDEYPIDRVKDRNFAGESNLKIAERDIQDYLHVVSGMNPPVKKALLRKRILVFRQKKVKEKHKYEFTHG